MESWNDDIEFAVYCLVHPEMRRGKEFCAWIKEPEHQILFEEVQQYHEAYLQHEDALHIDVGEEYKRLLQKMAAVNGKMAVTKRAGIRLWRRSYTIASLVLILVSVALGLWLKPGSENDIQPVQLILPGTTKATLILANGSQLDLTRNDLEEVIENSIAIKNDTATGLQYDETDVKVEKPVWHTVKVPVAGEYHFILQDGTKVWINSASELKFPVAFVGNNREVFVEGEAYFEVAEDEEHPFIVHAGEALIQVLGTKFNVAAYPEEQKVTTTLTAGKVHVEGLGQEMVLNPGFQAVLNVQSGMMEKQPVDTTMYVSWTRGIWEYENMPLSEITKQLSRWYDVNFIFSAPEFRTRRFTGVVKRYDILNHVLRIIEKTTNVRFVIYGKDVAIQAVE